MPDENEENVAAAADASDAGGEAAGEEGTGDQGGGADSAADAKTAENAADDAREPEERKRKTPSDFFKEREERRKAKAQAAEAAGGSAGEESEEEDGIAEADKETIGKVAGELVRPLIERHLEAEDIREVDEYLSKEGNEEFREYKQKALKWMNHPSRRNLPVETVFLEVVGREGLLRIGAERARKADEKARGTQAGGGTSRGDVAKDAWEMSKDEFAAEQLRIRMKGA